MSKLDPQCEFLADEGVAVLEEMAVPSEYARYGVRVMKKKRGAAAPPPVEVDILVQFEGDPAALEEVGMTVRSVAGDVMSGSIPIDRLGELAELAVVECVESSRALYTELDLATADSHVDDVQTGPPGYRGAGVIVGIVDSGIDYTHESFRRANGQTRILRIWDQALAPATGETMPAGFGYGVEYTDGQINTALAAADPFTVVRHRDGDSVRHGTHVSGIAAGDGSAPGQGQPAGTFAGVATEADIIVVGNVFGDAEGLGNSARALDAVAYIFQQATALGRPCVINMSLGDNLGPHDGTALLERGIDNLLGGAGRVLVKSAGNAAADRIHAQGNVATGATVDVQFSQPANDNTTNQMDVWYEGSDRFTVTVVDPAGNVAGPVAVGATSQVTLQGGNTVRISHRDNDPNNGDKRIFLTFAPGAAGTMRAGNWVLRLTSVSSAGAGRFDAWIQRGLVIPQFLAPHESPERTISTPGTANEVITAASHITRGAGVGGRSTFSSRGPTRDGRAAPTISAPGEWIISARGHATAGQDPYVQLAGTSMAAPHVTGAAALLLQKTPTLTAAQVAQTLQNNARTDAFTGPTPNTAWGAGKLDLLGAFPPVVTIRSVIEPGCAVSVAGTPCVSSVIQAMCRSVTTACISVPLDRCPPSMPRLSCFSNLIACPSLVPAGCQSVTIRCQSIPLCVDPGGIRSVVNCGDPITVVATTVINPTIVNRTVVANATVVGGFRQGAAFGVGGLRGAQFAAGGAPAGPQDAAGLNRSVVSPGCVPRVSTNLGGGSFATVFAPVCPSEIAWECPATIPWVDCPASIPGVDCPPWPPKTVPGVDCPVPPKTIPGVDCPPWAQTIPGVDCPPWRPQTIPGVNCPVPPKSVPGVDCPPWPKSVPGVDCPAVPKSVPGVDCPPWRPNTVPGVDCPTPLRTIPTMDCPTVASVPGRDCPVWSVPGVDCPSPFGPVFADPTRFAGGGQAAGSPDAGRRLGGPGSGLPGCGFGVSSPRDCTWWSVPDVNCGVVLPPSFATVDCPSVMPQDCLSQLIRPCPPPVSVPLSSCQTIPMRDCWAPTTAPGCEQPVSVPWCPSRVCTTVLTTVVNPTVAAITVVGGRTGGWEAYGAATTAGGEPESAGEAQGGKRSPAEQGYYDYDESWWE